MTAIASKGLGKGRARSRAGLGVPEAASRTIQVATGAGLGPTELAAFDAALRDAGIANFNLIYLSSVIPPMSEIEISADDVAQVEGAWGDRLYLVIAQERSVVPGAEAWAGIGWVQDDEDGRGLFVEHHGASELEVRSDIERSLEALCSDRGGEFGPVRMALRGVRCEREPVCALVTAVFGTEPWALESSRVPVWR